MPFIIWLPFASKKVEKLKKNSPIGFEAKEGKKANFITRLRNFENLK